MLNEILFVFFLSSLFFFVATRCRKLCPDYALDESILSYQSLSSIRQLEIKRGHERREMPFFRSRHVLWHASQEEKREVKWGWIRNGRKIPYECYAMKTRSLWWAFVLFYLGCASLCLSYLSVALTLTESSALQTPFKLVEPFFLFAFVVVVHRLLIMSTNCAYHSVSSEHA